MSLQRVYKTDAMSHLRPRQAIVISLVLLFATGVAVSGAGAQTAGNQAVPRTADGRPDFSGIWQVMNSAAWDIQDHQARKGVPAGMGVVEGNEIPYQPAALAKKRENFQNRATADPEAKCYLPGLPRLMYMPYPFQIFQTPAMVTMLFEYVHATRYIYTNGTPHPPGHIDWWMGDSRGRWEGDTLVVDVIDFNDQTWFDRSGNFHSEQLRVLLFVAVQNHAHPPRPCEHRRVLDRHLIVDVIGVERREAFDQVQLIAVEVAGAIEPRLVAEIDVVHNQRIAFPAGA